MAQLLRWDRDHKLRPVAIQSEEGQLLLAEVPQERRLASAHAIDPDGVVHSGGAAAALIAAALPGGVPFARIARAAPGPVRVAYGLVANNRMSFGRLISTERRARADAALAERADPR